MRFPFRPLNISVQATEDPLLEREIWLTHVSGGQRCGPEWFAKVSRPWMRMSHANIAGLYGVGGSDGGVHLCSEKVMGPSLNDLLQEGETLPPGELRWVLEGVGSALSYAHGRRVLHGSLSLDAVVWSTSVKLLRWSPEQLSCWSDAPAEGRIPPILPYQAPEQLRGDAYTPACDIYALGVLIYRLATGHLPFPERDIGWLCGQILGDPAPALTARAGYPTELSRVVEQCLSKHPRARPHCVQAVLRELYPDLAIAAPDHLRARGLEEAAHASFAHEKYSEALAALTQLDAQDGVVAHDLGVTLGRMEVWEEASFWLRQSTQALPGEPRVRRVLAWALREQGEEKAATGQLRRAVALELLEAGWTAEALSGERWREPAADHIAPRLLPRWNTLGDWTGGDNRPSLDVSPVQGVTELAALKARTRLGRSFRGTLHAMRRPRDSRNVEVSHGHDPVLNRRVTITHFRAAKGCTAEWLVESVGRWCCLHHVGIVPIYDIASQEDLVTVVSEPVSGPSLAERLHPPIPLDRRFSPREFRRLVLELAAALHHAHGYRVLHGTLSADAVVLTPKDGVRILRLAPEYLSTILDEGPLAFLPSTLWYRAPEQLQGRTTVASEVYAFGMLLYQTVTGGLPFKAQDQATLYRQICTLEPPRVSPPEGFPAALADVLASCLAKDPAARPASMVALVRALYPEETIPDIDRARQTLLHQEAVEAMDQERWHDAARAWSESRELDPADGLATNNVGVALAHDGSLLEEAEALFAQANLLCPEHFVPLLNRGWAGWRMGRPQQAAKDLRRALVLHPRCPEGYELLGYCLEGDAAVDEFQKALMLEPLRASAHHALARALDTLGQGESAAKHRQRAEELESMGHTGKPLTPIYACVDLGEDWEGKGGDRPPGDPSSWTSRLRPDHPDDGDGGAGVPLTRRPIAPSAAKAKSLPNPWD